MSKSTPSVGVVITSYNVGNYLLEAVDSVLAQSTPVEMLIVDDCSDDPATLAVLRQAEEAGQRVLRLESNQGPPTARNRAIEALDVDHILPLDGDDRIAPEYCALASAVLEEDPEVGIVYGHGRYFGGSDAEFNFGDYSLATMLHRNVIQSCAMFTRKDWEAVGGYPENLRMYEDYGLWLRILRLGRTVVRLDEELFFYRQGRPGQITSRMPRAEVIAANAAILRENVSLIAANADEYVTVRLDLWDNLMHWKRRYGRIENAISKVGALRARARARARARRAKRFPT